MGDESETKFTEAQILEAEEQIVEQSKRIEFYITEYTIEILALKMQNGDFEIPPYQREDIWEERRKSRFIESILMGLPIPFLFFWESPETGKLEIVDGSQRLRTIEQFILGNLVLGDLDQLSLLSGFGFQDLPESRQRKIKNRSIRGIVLSEHTDEQSRFDLFERINTGSKIAEKAEVRRGALSGKFQDLVISLAQEKDFMEIAPVPDQREKEREREELVTRFFAYSDGLDDYKDKVSPFLYNYTKKMNSEFEINPERMDIYRKRFIQTMKFVQKNFPWGFRRTKKGITSPRSRFEAIAIGSYYALSENPNIESESLHVEAWHDSEEFKKIIGADGANAKGKLIGRIDFVKERLLKE
ncbi:MAG: DUF262 domain-containing protein [Cyanobacteria bacterium P01_G01_bin.54]